jgi:hypothetical protein
MRFRTLSILLVLGLLAACGTGSPVAPPDGPAVPSVAEDTCGAAPYGGLVEQDATALERVLIMRQVRLIRPDQAVTMDFSAERINFWIGADNRIERITCG